MDEQHNMSQTPGGGPAQKNITLVIIAALMVVIAVLLVVIMREKDETVRQPSLNPSETVPAQNAEVKTENQAVSAEKEMMEADQKTDASAVQETMSESFTADQDLKAMEKDLDDGNQDALDDDELGDDQFAL